MAAVGNGNRSERPSSSANIRERALSTLHSPKFGASPLSNWQRYIAVAFWFSGVFEILIPLDSSNGGYRTI
jgi:hypothetical protein